MTNHIKSNKIKSTSKLADYKKFQYKDLTKNIDNSDINRRKNKVMNLAELRNNALKYTEEKLEYVDTNFIQIGPNVITNDQGNHGNTISITGKITDLAIDYRNNEIIYVATRKGGLWKTIDGGLNWSPISDHEKSLSVGAIVIHPKNPNILYAGTGETDSRENYYGNGILKTVDGGNKWEIKGESEFLGIGIYHIEIIASPNSILEDIIIAATTKGLFLSKNSGENWELIESQKVTDVIIDRYDSNDIKAFYATPDNISKVQAISINPDLSQYKIIKLDNLSYPSKREFSKIVMSSYENPGEKKRIIYALLKHAKDPTQDEFWVKENYNVWNKLKPIEFQNNSKIIDYDISILSYPSDPDIVYLGRQELWKATRNPVTNTWNFEKIGNNFSPRCNVLKSKPKYNNILYCGTDRGIYQSIDNGMTWTDNINKGLCIAQIMFIEKHPISDTIMLVGSDVGTQQFRNSSVFYQSTDIKGGFCTIDKSDPKIYYLTYSTDFIPYVDKSEKAGKFGKWYPINNGLSDPSLNYPPLGIPLYDPTSKSIAIGTNYKIYIDDDRGRNGWKIQITLPNIDIQKGENVSAILYLTNELLYVGTNKGKIYRLGFANGNWNAILIRNSSHDSQLPVSDISILPSNNNIVIITSAGFGEGHEGRIFRGEIINNNWEWTNINNNLPDIPCNALSVDQLNHNKYYLATDIGLFITYNGGDIWNRFGANILPNCRISDLLILSHKKYPLYVLRVATDGRGIWETRLDKEINENDIFVRDHIMDDFRLSPSPDKIHAGYHDELRDIILDQELHRDMCADIKIDAQEGSPPSYQMDIQDVDYVAFETKLKDRDPHVVNENRIYVQVHNKGLGNAKNVDVKILCADIQTGLPLLPKDFWIEFPGNSGNTTKWKPIGKSITIDNLLPTKPKILEWEWKIPSDFSKDIIILCIINCNKDPIPEENKNKFNIEELCAIDKHMSYRKVKTVGS